MADTPVYQVSGTFHMLSHFYSSSGSWWFSHYLAHTAQRQKGTCPWLYREQVAELGFDPWPQENQSPFFPPLKSVNQGYEGAGPGWRVLVEQEGATECQGFAQKWHSLSADHWPFIPRKCHCFADTYQSPRDCKEIKPVNPKGNQPWIFFGRTDPEAEAPILWSLNTLIT